MRLMMNCRGCRRKCTLSNRGNGPGKTNNFMVISMWDSNRTFSKYKSRVLTLCQMVSLSYIFVEDYVNASILQFSF